MMTTKPRSAKLKSIIIKKWLMGLASALFPILAMAQWINQSPVPTHLEVRGVAAPTADRVFVATDDDFFDQGGALFQSDDGGTTWVQRDIPVSLSSPLNGIFFRDSLNGWVYGNENYLTTDGGLTWSEMPFLGSTYFMEFYTGSFGLATGNFGAYVSTDSGLSWDPSPNGMLRFSFSGDLVGLGVSDSAIFRTADGGATFTSVYDGNAMDVAFLTGSVAVAIVDSSFMRSSDGGVTWVPVTDADICDHLAAVSGSVVLAWGRSGFWPDYNDLMFRSSDGGQTWTNLGEVIPAGIYSLAVVDEQTVVAADFSGNIYHTDDAALNWNEAFTSPGPQPGYIGTPKPSFAGSQVGYFGYGPGFVIKTTDGGASWIQISSGTGFTLNDIGHFSNGNLLAVGEYGTLLSSDGDSPWILHEKFSDFHLKAVHCFGAMNAAVVDESGQVFISTDGGNSWLQTNASPSGVFNAEDVHFTSLQDGWVIGQGNYEGALYHTTDGGNTWFPVPDILGGYVAVDVQGTKVWAANVSGPYYYSTDNGATWTEGSLPGFPVQIRDMEFYDEFTGYAAGSYGEVYRSSDGGLTWELLPTPNNSDHYTDIFLLGADELWMSTNNDVAYYSATGGQNWAVMDIGSGGFGTFSAITANASGGTWTVGYQGFIEHFQGTPPPPLNQPPVALFSFLASGLTVEFTDNSTDPDGTITAWEWDFGDGNSSTLQNPTHTYDTANTYIVTLTVTDDDDTTGTTLQIITVQPNPGGVFGDFTEVTPLDSLFVTPQDEDFWVITTAPADFDNDGDLDIAVLGYYVVYYESVVDKLILMRNEGYAVNEQWVFTYIDVPLGENTSGSSDMAWGDYDSDGDLDLAVGTDGATLIYENLAGALEMTGISLPGYWEDNSQADFDLRSITWADFDNDSDPDLLIPSAVDTTTFTYRTKLMRNDGPDGSGGWIFAETDSVLVPTSHAQSAWADHDNDQDLDLFLVNIDPFFGEGFIRLYRNDSIGVFTGENILGDLTVEHGEAQWGDYDGDGDLDILVAGNVREPDGNYTHMTLRIYQNDAENYSPFEVIDCLTCEGWFDVTAATWADYDSDGDMDILLAGNYNSGSQIEGRARIYINNDTAFVDSGNELPAPRASGDRGGTFSWLDIDNDGDLDYFIAGQYFVPGGNGLVEAQMHLYRNDTPGQNAAPLSPLPQDVVQVSENTVLLTWLAGSDDHTPQESLTYDLEIYRDNVPLNLPDHTPEPGNVSAVSQWQITGLEPGNYTWTIRAVDASYTGSPLAYGEFSVDIVSVEEQPGIKETEQISLNNYPNPFSRTTTISYSIPEDGLVTIKIYNLAGEEVITLVEEKKQAGDHSLVFNASDLKAGIYFYKIRSGVHSLTNKMIVSK